jgi:hypothetical protein
MLYKIIFGDVYFVENFNMIKYFSSKLPEVKIQECKISFFVSEDKILFTYCSDLFRKPHSHGVRSNLPSTNSKIPGLEPFKSIIVS